MNCNAIFLCLFISLTNPNLYAQKTPSNWSVLNPIQSNVFVENKGQFDVWLKNGFKAKYAINNSDKIYFNQHGITFRIDSYRYRKNLLGRFSKRKEEQEERVIPLRSTDFVELSWTGANPNVQLSATDVAQGYNTYGEKGYEHLKLPGYKKLIYRDLYPGIDLEYNICEKGGVKYQFVVKPNADPNQIRLNFKGGFKRIELTPEGNISVLTAAGYITDHAPQSYLQDSKTPVKSAFRLEGNEILFALDLPPNRTENLIIDPWTLTPTTLTSNQIAFDAEIDIRGNTYIAGGDVSIPYKVAKLDPFGNLLWTYTLQSDWCPEIRAYSEFTVLPKSGSLFMGEGFNVSGPRVFKLSTDGIKLLESSNFLPNNEIWSMFFNSCSGQLIAFGGGTSALNNTYSIADTNLTSASLSNFNDVSGAFCCNDVACARVDANGDFYALLSSQDLVESNYLFKSLSSNNYQFPPAFGVNTNYDFFECTMYGIPEFGDCNDGTTVRANAIALNIDYVYSYDGKQLDAWDKNNGSKLGSVVVSPAPSIKGGRNRIQEGIDVDACNNVYVGATGIVKIYNFNGSQFQLIDSITSNVPGAVFDVKINHYNGTVALAGRSFITILNLPVSCAINPPKITFTTDSCSLFSICAEPSSGIPPFHYFWNTGDTTQCLINVPFGNYSVTIFDNSCDVYSGSQQLDLFPYIPKDVIVQGDTSYCNTNSVELLQLGAFHPIAANYEWIPALGLSDALIANPVASVNKTSSYQVIVTDTAGCLSYGDVTIRVNPSPLVNAGPDLSACSNKTFIVNASGADTLIWNPGVNNGVAFTLDQGSYQYVVTGIDTNSCKDTDTILITSLPSPIADFSFYQNCDETLVSFQNYSKDSSNFPAGSTFFYNWNFGNSTTSETIENPVHDFGAYGSNRAVLTVSSDLNNCVDSLVRSFVLWPAPAINLSYSVDCFNEFTFQAQFTPADSLMEIISWNFNDNSIELGGTSKTHRYPTAGTFMLELIVSDSNNCKAEYSTLITVMGAYDNVLNEIPNIITPNGDLVNDVFDLDKVFTYCDNFSYTILNRWGNPVFFSKKGGEPFSGYDMEGKELVPGVYFYRLDNQGQIYSGNITLVRD